MAELDVVVAVPFGEGFFEIVRAADPRVRARVAPPELRRWLRDELPDTPGALETALQQAEATLASADVLVTFGKLRPETMRYAPKLRWIQFASAGVERIDPADYPGVTLSNASGVGSVAIAEYVIGMLLASAKRFPTLLRNQQAHRWDRRIFGAELSGRTLGIVGLGAIGREVAKRARALEMRVLASRRSAAPGDTDADVDELLPADRLDRLLAESDYLLLAVPLTADTTALIGAAELAKMKGTARLINVARGPVVDQAALIAALRAGTIAGTVLDVFDEEPLPADSPLWDLENVIVTPHLAADSDRYAERVAGVTADNLRRYLAGEPLRNLVDGERRY